MPKAKKLKKLSNIRTARNTARKLVAKIDTASIDPTMLPDNANANAIAPTTNDAPLSNNAPYTTSDAVHDVIIGTTSTGRAEAGFIVALKNDEDWQPKRDAEGKWHSLLVNYWNAPERNTDKRGRRIPGSPDTRAQIANIFLMKYPEYVEIAAQYTAAVATVKEGKKAKNVTMQVEADHAVALYKKVINNAQAMVNRALKSVWWLRETGAVSVTLGETNGIHVVNANPDDKKLNGSFRASNLRDLGDKMLKDAGKIEVTKRETTPVTQATPIAVNSLTAKVTAASFVELLESGKLEMPLNSEAEGTVLDKNDAAEMALAVVSKMTREDTTDEELRGTLSQIAVAVMGVLGVKSASEANKIVKASANGG